MVVPERFRFSGDEGRSSAIVMGISPALSTEPDRELDGLVLRGEFVLSSDERSSVFIAPRSVPGALFGIEGPVFGCVGRRRCSIIVSRFEAF
jgi:hypothetical protein